MYTEHTYISPNKFISYDILFSYLNHKNEIRFYDHSVYEFLDNKFKTNMLNIKNKRILDIGSNIGSYSFLVEKYGGIATGIECNNKIYNLCLLIKDKIKSNAEFININIDDYDIKNKYDIILIFNDPITMRSSPEIVKKFLLKLLISNADYIYMVDNCIEGDKYIFNNLYKIYYIDSSEKINDNNIYFTLYKKRYK